MSRSLLLFSTAKFVTELDVGALGVDLSVGRLVLRISGYSDSTGPKEILHTQTLGVWSDPGVFGLRWKYNWPCERIEMSWYRPCVHGSLVRVDDTVSNSWRIAIMVQQCGVKPTTVQHQAEDTRKVLDKWALCSLWLAVQTKQPKGNMQMDSGKQINLLWIKENDAAMKVALPTGLKFETKANRLWLTAHPWSLAINKIHFQYFFFFKSSGPEKPVQFPFQWAKILCLKIFTSASLVFLGKMAQFASHNNTTLNYLSR